MTRYLRVPETLGKSERVLSSTCLPVYRLSPEGLHSVLTRCYFWTKISRQAVHNTEDWGGPGGWSLWLPPEQAHRIPSCPPASQVRAGVFVEVCLSAEDSKNVMDASVVHRRTISLTGVNMSFNWSSTAWFSVCHKICVITINRSRYNVILLQQYASILYVARYFTQNWWVLNLTLNPCFPIKPISKVPALLKCFSTLEK